MTQIDWVKVEVSDIRPDGTERRYSQMWDARLCSLDGSKVINTHTGRAAKLLDAYTATESGAPDRKVK